MVRIVVVGGGLGGCAAAAAARKAGAQVTLLERMEVIGGWLRFACRLDARYLPVREELRLMAGDDIFKVLESCIYRTDVFPESGAPDVVKQVIHTSKAEIALKKYLDSIGVDVRLQCRAKDIEAEGKGIKAVILDDGTSISGDVFIDATGGSGPQSNCQKYGNGCAMCFIRCPAFGGRVSMAARAGVKELKGLKKDGSVGATNAGFAILKESLAPDLREKIEREGWVSIPVPAEFIEESYQRTRSVAPSSGDKPGYAENIILVNMGIYVMRIGVGYTPLEELRRTPGLEEAVFAEPYAGTMGSPVRFMSVTPRDDALKVPGVDNMLVASEKLGISGIGEVIVTGVVAGHNAVREAAGMPPLILPRTTILGDYIAYIVEGWQAEARLKTRPHVRDGAYLRRAEEMGLYTEDKGLIASRIRDNNLMNAFGKNLVR